MNLVNTIDQYNDNNIFFCEPIKNNIMSDGYFIRILYADRLFTLNGVYLCVPLQDITCDKFYTKYKCSFSVSAHKLLIEQLKRIEETLLHKYKTSKVPSYKIHEQLKLGYIKLFADVGAKSHCSFALKISGIWETQYNYGLTYKFVKLT